MNLLGFVMNTLNHKAQNAFNRHIRLMKYNAIQWGLTELYLYMLFLVPAGYFIYQFIHQGTGVDVLVMIIAIQGNITALGREFMHLMTELSNNKIQMDILAKHMTDLVNDIHQQDFKDIKKWHKIIVDQIRFSFSRRGAKFVLNVPWAEINQRGSCRNYRRIWPGKKHVFEYINAPVCPRIRHCFH